MSVSARQAATEVIIAKLDEIARNYTNDNYGLPIYNPELYCDMSQAVDVVLGHLISRKLEAIARFVENWGGRPPNPAGRRAALAADIRKMGEQL